MTVELKKPDCFVFGATILKGSSLIEICSPGDSCRFDGNCMFHSERAGKPEDWVGGGDRVIPWREGVSGKKRTG